MVRLAFNASATIASHAPYGGRTYTIGAFVHLLLVVALVLFLVGLLSGSRTVV